MISLRYFTFALLTPLSLGAQGVASGGARPISLPEAVRLAQQNAPAAVQARGQLRASDAAIRTAYGSYLPSLNLNLGGTEQLGQAVNPNGSLIAIRNPWNFSRGVSTNLELFDGMRRINQLRSAQASQSSAEANERLQKYLVALNVKQQYFNVLAARESQGSATAQLAQAQEQLNSANARVRAGAATISDSLRSIIQVGNARLAVLTADNNLRVSNANLTRLVGTAFEVTAESGENEAIAVVRFDSVQVARAIDEAPSVQQARTDLAASMSTHRASRSTYYPSLNMSYNLNGNRAAESFDPLRGRYSSAKVLRFTMSYPIFNGFGREENVTRASIAENTAQAQLRDALLLAQQQLTQFVGSLRLAEARVAIQLASVTAADEDLRVQNQRYALGGSTLLDVLTSQTQLNQARTALIQARYDARVARAQIEALLGRDLQ